MKVAVIGAYGSAGVAVAEGLVDADGISLVLFDDGEPGGGLCILRGCMPSKEVLSGAAHRYQARADERLTGKAHELDLDEVVDRKDDHVLGFAEHRRDAVHTMAERDDVEFVRETARVVDDTTVEAGGDEYDVDRVVVATGSSVNVPDLPGIEDVGYMTSDDVLDARSFGDTGVVMGFGTTGMEMVPYLAEAGVDLTVIEHDAAPLDYADDGFGRELLELYRDEFGVEVLTHTYEQSLEPTEDGGVRLHVEVGDESESGIGSDEFYQGEEHVIEADDLYLFTGRKPNVEGLGLENAGVEPTGDWVDGTLRARDNPRVYAVGDLNGREPILHVAKEEGYHTAENIIAEKEGREPRRYGFTKHRVTFTGAGVYPFARLGMTEEEARESGVDYVVAERDAASDGVFKTKDVPHGRAKLVVDANDGTVLGWQALHYHADAMAKTMQVVVELGLDVRDLPHRAYHPTTPEILDGLFRETAEKVREF
ncbi:NAD(P)/FAD-dependent oxidoreductase [Haladaptatus sp. F3-133]|jgi:pyruvate/2-oxoglutarate dehydrogenase complex dihydrolipoamide dehydrogenase (E3) component|uniref:NAD(P)/FAD-dependent oxidoreductase n=1 Tax=Halorutilus salinus TaxID=2487751 RepID=A0A9Q4C3B4_9EURY|nr:NAD(P)/FAD-dependent oxidoreductase [Halorutilus salinus]MCX2818518.1 NAD(P)/FAD-dependent oxidoreductase [Halorutilus salinus]